MLKENQKVKVRWNPFTKKYYESKGYIYTKMQDEFEVNVEDLQEGSHALVIVICDFCGKEFIKPYREYVKHHDNGDCCIECEGKKSFLVLEEKYGKGIHTEILKNGIKNNYGVTQIMEIPEIREKIRQTNLERYGVGSYLESVDHSKSGKMSWTEEARKKRITTNLLKYGTEYSLSSDIVRTKINESYYKNGSIATSSQQLELYNLLLKYYNNCELNFPCGKYFLDCAIVINNIKIDIEYDGKYWHSQKSKQDLIRDTYVNSQNYKILRIAGNHSIPSYQEIAEKINILLTTDSLIEKIIMV